MAVSHHALGDFALLGDAVDLVVVLLNAGLGEVTAVLVLGLHG